MFVINNKVIANQARGGGYEGRTISFFGHISFMNGSCNSELEQVWFDPKGSI